MKPWARITVASSTALVALLVAVAWLMLAPPQLGGHTSYVIINGNSMEPGMERGDLALVRPADRYRPGDIVTYRHPEIGHVIHRIVDEQGGRFTLKGDNNDFLDSYRPTSDEIVGELWLHVPAAGSLFAHLRSPFWAGLVLFLALAWVLAGNPKATTNRRTGPRRRQSPSGGHPMAPIYRNWQDSLALLLAMALGFAALAWVSFGRVTTTPVPVDLDYTQRGTFGYEAATTDPSVYDTGRATTGQPVFLRLSESVDFSFTYHFEAENASDLAGTYHLVAELGDISGWTRTVPLGEPGAFAGAAFQTSGTLRLADLQHHIATLEQQTGVRNDRYTVTVRPRVQVAGRLDGVPFQATFEQAALPMALDRVQLRLEAGDPASRIEPVATSVVTATRPTENAIRLLFIDLPVVVGRAIGVIGALAASALAIVLLVKVAQRGWRDPAEGHPEPVSVHVSGPVAAAATQVFDVLTLADLERLAERVGGIILQESHPGRHVSYVRDGHVVYRYAFDPGEYGTERAA
jgi:signal peptidase I